jgi:hypothetical protein
MSKRTPGPWKVVHERAAAETDLFEIADVERFRIVCDRDGNGYDIAGAPLNDAILIAAAPRMLSALEAILALNNTESNEWDAVERVIPEIMQIARSAIESATKEQP